MVVIKQEKFGKYFDPLSRKKVMVKKFTMTNHKNISVSVITLGAIIQSVKIPDTCGNIENVCLGFDNLDGYKEHQAKYFGATVGRVANRIASGRFKIAAEDYQVTKNYKGQYHLHGGLIGFDRVVWDILSVNEDGVTLQHISPAGHEGYPGELTTRVDFSLAENGSFRIYVEARCDKTTIVNVSNHAYFNLAGHGAGKDALYAHFVMIKADKLVDTDIQQIPTGTLMPVKNTPYDLQQMSNLGQRIKKMRDCPITGFDNCYCVDPPKGRTTLVAKVVHACSGRWLEIHSNQPGLVFYTANNLPDVDNGDPPLVGREEAHYVKHGSFCVETGKYPNAPNHANFKNMVLNPDEKYCHECVYRFGYCGR